jgi:peptidoglycan/LPS O-acetylase OafA/YrhL
MTAENNVAALQSTNATQRKLTYRADIDGLRAVAVLAVLLFHVELGVPGGYCGVDVFFVISGYLIAHIVLSELEQGRFSLRNFWLRRVRRIVPMQIVVTLSVLFVGCLVMLPPDLQALAKSAVAQIGLVSNVWFWRDTDYFAGPSELKPLLHTWSLAVEEQFYLIFPFVISILWRWIRRPGICLVFSVVFLLSMLLNLYLVQRSPSATFFLLPTRAWELIAGILLALTRLKVWRDAAANLAAWLGLSALLYSFFLFDAETVFPGLAAAVPVSGTALLIAANTNSGTIVSRILCCRVFTFTGLISYSLYLWHWPLLAFYHYSFGSLNTPAAIAIVGLSYFMATVTWLLVEQPIRRRIVLGNPRRLVSLAGMAMFATVLLAGVAGYGGLRWRFPESVLRVIDEPNWHRQKVFKVTDDDIRNGELPVLGVPSGEDGDIAFLLWGDSYAGCIAELADRVAEDEGITGALAARGGMPPLPQSWLLAQRDFADAVVDWNEFCLRFVAGRRVRAVVLVAAWDLHMRGITRLTDGQKHLAHGSSAVFRLSFRQLVDRLEHAGVEIFVLLQVPYQHQSVPLLVARDVLRGSVGDTQGVPRERHEEFQRETREFFLEFGDRIRLVDASGYCIDGSGRTLIGRRGVPFYTDTGHLSAVGAKVFLERPLREVMHSIVEDKED